MGKHVCECVACTFPGTNDALRRMVHRGIRIINGEAPLSNSCSACRDTGRITISVAYSHGSKVILTKACPLCSQFRSGNVRVVV